jgi:hypothetical protein
MNKHWGSSLDDFLKEENIIIDEMEEQLMKESVELPIELPKGITVTVDTKYHNYTKIYENWYLATCYDCGGKGLYHADCTFLGPRECNTCDGNGKIWVHNKSGAMAKYPGGPFIGKLSKEELLKDENNVS